MDSMIPPFEGCSEGIMACLASRPEDWRLWSIEEFHFQTWDFFPESGQHVLRRTRFRALLSLIRHGRQNWDAVGYWEKSSPSDVAVLLLTLGGQVASKREWLKQVRNLDNDAPIEKLFRELSTLNLSFLSGDLRLSMRTLLRRKKDSKGRFETSNAILCTELYSNGVSIFKGAPEDLAIYLCN